MIDKTPTSRRTWTCSDQSTPIFLSSPCKSARIHICQRLFSQSHCKGKPTPTTNGRAGRQEEVRSTLEEKYNITPAEVQLSSSGRSSAISPPLRSTYCDDCNGSLAFTFGCESITLEAFTRPECSLTQSSSRVNAACPVQRRASGPGQANCTYHTPTDVHRAAPWPAPPR